MRRWMLLCAGLLVVIAAEAHELHFTIPEESQPACGGYVAQAFAVDFDHDGKNDIVGRLTDKLFTIKGNGDGTFRPCVTTAPSAKLKSVLAIADLDGDGFADVVAQPDSGAQVLVFRGQADGTFSIGEGITLAAAPNNVAVGDVNGDGKPDLVATSGRDDAAGITVLLNQGASFAAGVTYACYGAAGVALNDVNRDGKLDIAVMSGNLFKTLPGNGDGTFGAAQTIATFGSDAELLDLNGDGIVDVAIAAYGWSYVGLSSGGKLPTKLIASEVGRRRSEAVWADVDGDGIADFISHRSGLVYVSHGNADGSFTRPRAFYKRGISGEGAVVADFDGDHRADVVVLGQRVGDHGYALWLFRGKGDGSLDAQEGIVAGKLSDTPYVRAVVADVNGDGRPDLVVTDDVTVAVFENDGSGRFSMKAELPLPKSFSQATRLYVTDVDGDGHADVVYSNEARAAIYYGSAAGTFTAAPIIDVWDGVGSVILIGAGSFSGNAQHQLVFSWLGSFDVSSWVVSPHRDGTFDVTATLANRYADAVADVDGDGRSDLLNGTRVAFYDGGGRFSIRDYQAGGSFVDVDGDGMADFISGATARTAPQGEYWVTRIQKMQRNRRLSDPIEFSGTFGSRLLPARVDFNGDGMPDLLLSDGVIWLNRGDGMFDPAEKVIDLSFNGLASDLDGDGRTDLVLMTENAILPLLNRVTSYGTQPLSLKLEIKSGSFGLPLPLTVTTTATPKPSGWLTIRDGQKILGYTSVTSETPLWLPLSVESHVTAEYSGDAIYAPYSVSVPSTVTPTIVLVGVDVDGNYIRLPVPVTARIVPLEHRYLGPLTGTISLIVNGAIVATAPAAPEVKFMASLTELRSNYGVAAVYSGDPNQIGSTRTATVMTVDPPVALDRTTINVTKVPGTTDYNVDVTFSDSEGAAVPAGKMTFFMSRLLTTSGTVGQRTGVNPYRWTVHLQDNSSSALVRVTVNGVTVAGATLGPAPPRHRAMQP